MNPWRVAGTALATIVLAGCMMGPNYERAAPSLPPSYPDVPSATATSAAAPVVRPDWWMLYGDATLDRLVATALSDNLDVAVAADVPRFLERFVDRVGGLAASLADVAR